MGLPVAECESKFLTDPTKPRLPRNSNRTRFPSPLSEHPSSPTWIISYYVQPRNSEPRIRLAKPSSAPLPPRRLTSPAPETHACPLSKSAHRHVRCVCVGASSFSRTSTCDVVVSIRWRTIRIGWGRCEIRPEVLMGGPRVLEKGGRGQRHAPIAGGWETRLYEADRERETNSPSYRTFRFFVFVLICTCTSSANVCILPPFDVDFCTARALAVYHITPGTEEAGDCQSSV